MGMVIQKQKKGCVNALESCNRMALPPLLESSGEYFENGIDLVRRLNSLCIVAFRTLFGLPPPSIPEPEAQAATHFSF
jgi:hypothetical protein